MTGYVRVRLEATDPAAVAVVLAAITGAAADVVAEPVVYDRSEGRRGRVGVPGMTHTYLTVAVPTDHNRPPTPEKP